MRYWWGDTESACRTRYELWATELGAMLAAFAGSCFASDPIIPWTELVFFMAVFNILAWGDRRRWKFHQALNRLTRPTEIYNLQAEWEALSGVSPILRGSK